MGHIACEFLALVPMPVMFWIPGPPIDDVDQVEKTFVEQAVGDYEENQWDPGQPQSHHHLHYFPTCRTSAWWRSPLLQMQPPVHVVVGMARVIDREVERQKHQIAPPKRRRRLDAAEFNDSPGSITVYLPRSKTDSLNGLFSRPTWVHLQSRFADHARQKCEEYVLYSRDSQRSILQQI